MSHTSRKTSGSSWETVSSSGHDAEPLYIGDDGVATPPLVYTVQEERVYFTKSDSVNGSSRDPGIPEVSDRRGDWATCLSSAQEFDINLLESWRRDLDNVLVFAALFSAVVTAFIIESYQWLSEDPADATVTLLISISAQLANSTNLLEHVLPNPSSSFHATIDNIAINVLWFGSLILSLNSVIMSILFKEWLSEYVWNHGSQPMSARKSLALRHLRFKGLAEWGLMRLINYIPLQLLLAVFIFFIGLAIMTWNLNFAVWVVTISLTGFSMVFVLFTSLIPVWHPTCAFHSQLSWICYHAGLRFGRKGTPSPAGWTDVLTQQLERDEYSDNDAKCLQWIHRMLCPTNPTLFPIIWRCACSLQGPLARRTLCNLIKRSAEYTIWNGKLYSAEHAKAVQYLIGADLFEEGLVSLLGSISSSDSCEKLVGAPLELVETMQVVCSFLSIEHRGDSLSTIRGISFILSVLDGSNGMLKYILEDGKKKILPNCASTLHLVLKDNLLQDFGDDACLDILESTDEAILKNQSNIDKLYPYLSGLVLYFFTRKADFSSTIFLDPLHKLTNSMTTFLSTRTNMLELSESKALLCSKKYDPSRDIVECCSEFWTRILLLVKTKDGQTQTPFSAEDSVNNALQGLLLAIDRARTDSDTAPSNRENLDTCLLAWGPPHLLSNAIARRVHATFESGEEFSWYNSGLWCEHYGQDIALHITDVFTTHFSVPASISAYSSRISDDESKLDACLVTAYALYAEWMLDVMISRVKSDWVATLVERSTEVLKSRLFSHDFVQKAFMAALQKVISIPYLLPGDNPVKKDKMSAIRILEDDLKQLHNAISIFVDYTLSRDTNDESTLLLLSLALRFVFVFTTNPENQNFSKLGEILDAMKSRFLLSELSEKRLNEVIHKWLGDFMGVIKIVRKCPRLLTDVQGFSSLVAAMVEKQPANLWPKEDRKTFQEIQKKIQAFVGL